MRSHNTKKNVYTAFIKRLTQLLFVFYILPLVACPLWGQVVQKKIVEASDNHLWGVLGLDKISADQEWVSYKMRYENGIDSLFVQNTITNKTYNLPYGDKTAFINNNSFTTLFEKNLYILNLKTGKKEIIKSVNQYNYSALTNYLIIDYEATNQQKMVIRNPDGRIKKEISNLTGFSLSPDELQLLYTTKVDNKSSIILLNLKTQREKQLLVEGRHNYAGVTWQRYGKSLAFIAKTELTSETSLFYYLVQQDQLFELKSETLADSGFPDKASLADDNRMKLLVSDDMRKVFFTFKDTGNVSENKPDSDVEIWNGNDKWVYAQEQIYGNFHRRSKIALWFPLSNTIVPITTEKLPKLMLTGNQDYAVLSNPKEYEPQFDQDGPRDFHIMNLQTVEKTLFLKKQSAYTNSIIPSPMGKYIAYFKEKNWWIYNIIDKTHTNITKNIETNFSAKEEILNPESICGNPGWSLNDKEILLYDQYDIWAIKPDGTSPRRLTHGRESKVKYRIAESPDKYTTVSLSDEIKIENYDLQKELYLSSVADDGKTGFFKWTNHSGAIPLVHDDALISDLYYTQKKEKFFYLKQRFDLPIQLIMQYNKSKTKVVCQSNPQFQKYHWGASELIRYQNAKGESLKAVLLYPANYDPKKKYPMVVHIYELQSKNLHQFVSPSLYNETGFNPSLFTLNGYFVLLPDIALAHQNPGISALDCTVSAVKKVIGKRLINPMKIGLIGHSFGGYESFFISTQTNLFVAAIAGGGITDLKSFYLTLNRNTGKPDMWRFETSQWMMGKTPFEAPLPYWQNSPIDHVEKTKTPLLTWTGKNDRQVDPNQSMEYYLALRRLGKKSIMLLYPSEGHVLQKPENQQDLTMRALQWFDYYLKGDLTNEWITTGMQ